jgi:DNA-binding MarR family transcriptional regulator
MSNHTETVDLTEHLPALLFSISAKVSQHAHRNSARELDLDMCEWRVVQILGRDGPSSINQVADRISMDRGGTSRAISRLEKRDIICRKGDQKDRRRSTVSLTNAGQSLHKPIAEFANRREAALKSCLTLKEAELLDAVLVKLGIQIDVMLGNSDGRVEHGNDQHS